MKIPESVEKSPIPSTVDKYWEAYYFLMMMLECYHEPFSFRYNLNAFMQSLRSITDILQKETIKPSGFEDWVKCKIEELIRNDLLFKFKTSRDLVVHIKMLSSRSTAKIGLFRYRMFKLGYLGDISPFANSQFLLKMAANHFIGYMIDEEHSAIGEQVGIYREWIVESIGEGDISHHCINALYAMGKFLEETHLFYGSSFDPSFDVPKLEHIRILLESDQDPSLPEKWGWTDFPK